MADLLNSSLLRNIISKVLMLIVATTFFFASSAQTFTILDDFEDGTFDGGTGNSAAVWTVLNGGFTVASAFGGNNYNTSKGLFTTDSSNRISTPFSKVCDAWECQFKPESTLSGQFDAYFFYMTDASADPVSASGYYVVYNHSDGRISLRRMDNGNIGNIIISASRGFSTSTFTVKVTRQNNNWTLFINNSSVGTGFDATYPPNICAYQGIWMEVWTRTFKNNDAVDNIKYAEVAGCTTGTQEICGNGVDDDCDGLTDNVYRFVGDGNFSVDANWQCGSAPPNPLPENTFVIIDPQVNGRCNLDIEYTVSPKAKFTVAQGKELLLPTNLILQ
jgi:hypothetical protein